MLFSIWELPLLNRQNSVFWWEKKKLVYRKRTKQIGVQWVPRRLLQLPCTFVQLLKIKWPCTYVQLLKIKWPANCSVKNRHRICPQALYSQVTRMYIYIYIGFVLHFRFLPAEVHHQTLHNSTISITFLYTHTYIYILYIHM